MEETGEIAEETGEIASDAELAALARTFLAARDAEWQARYALWRAMRHRDEDTIIVDDAVISRDKRGIDSLAATKHLRVD